MGNNGLSRTGAFTLLAISCLTIMVGCVIVPGLSTIAPALGVSGAESWLVTLPALGVVLFAPLAGAIIDQEGPRRALLAGLFFYGALGTAGMLLYGPIPVLLDRLFLGGATALVMAAGTSLLSQFYQGEQRLKMIARQGMAIELGGVLFLALGGVLATLSWQAPFALYLFAWLFFLMLLLWVPRQTQQPEASADEAPAATSPPLRPVYSAALLSMVCFFAAIVMVPLYFSQLAIGAAATGYFLSFVSLVAVAAAWQMPGVVRRWGSTRTLTLAFCCYGLGHLLFACSQGWLLLLPAGVAMGLGFGFSVPLVNHLTIEQSPEKVRGKNLARLSMAIFSGQVLSSLLASLPLAAQGLFVCAALLACASPFIIRRAQRKAGKATTASG